jgi:hypothetical protein
MITTTVKERSEILKDEQELIKGDFSPEDAADVLNHLITKKINFHEMRSFSSEIRFGEVDKNSIKRAKELTQSRQSINDMIKLAKEQGKNLRVSSTISIEIV